MHSTTFFYSLLPQSYLSDCYKRQCGLVKKKKPFKAPAYVNSSICFYSSMSHASAGLVYGHLKSQNTWHHVHKYNNIQSLKWKSWISHNLSQNRGSYFFCHYTYKLARNASQYHITKGTTWHIIKIANAVDLITLKTRFLTQRHGILITKTNHLKLFRETVLEYSMNHVKPNKRDWTKCRF